MKWFGKHWGAAVCDECDQTSTPEGALCLRCEEVIRPGDNGMILNDLVTGEEKIFHHECMMRQVVGGVNHLKRLCTCCGGTEPPDPPGMTKRQAARAALRYYEEHV